MGWLAAHCGAISHAYLVHERDEDCTLPMSSFAKKTPMMTVASSGALEPAAINVAPATSGDILSSESKQLS